MKRIYKIGLIALLQIIFLFLMLGLKYYTLACGVPVLLKTAPVDPWDVFRGEYVALQYDISMVESGNLDIMKDGLANKRVYVVLEKGDKYWNATGIYLEKPGLRDNQVFIKGKLLYYDDQKNAYQITYGIETYYVEEGSGREIDRLRNLEAQVRIDRFGNAVIETIL